MDWRAYFSVAISDYGNLTGGLASHHGEDVRKRTSDGKKHASMAIPGVHQFSIPTPMSLGAVRIGLSLYVKSIITYGKNSVE
ncbi:hypothetical protein Pyn_04792 [Prunus yedoensis var. nudiflora]|uniref:Uncharacterized protein n=1 Tax=Prunus yedoensis var. nudiflora TaxID=2094558 RepID=A0A314UG09_PRUYE|nr:hypothetical protein Pyn_04792 [Prunus yedoensis var. nudiflora]